MEPNTSYPTSDTNIDIFKKLVYAPARMDGATYWSKVKPFIDELEAGDYDVENAPDEFILYPAYLVKWSLPIHVTLGTRKPKTGTYSYYNYLVIPDILIVDLRLNIRDLYIRSPFLTYINSYDDNDIGGTKEQFSPKENNQIEAAMDEGMNFVIIERYRTMDPQQLFLYAHGYNHTINPRGPKGLSLSNYVQHYGYDNRETMTFYPNVSSLLRGVADILDRSGDEYIIIPKPKIGLSDNEENRLDVADLLNNGTLFPVITYNVGQ